MEELIEKIIKDYDLPTRDNTTFENIESRMIDAFLEFGKQVCDLQKQECEDYENWNRRGIKFGKTNITNCINVCTT